MGKLTSTLFFALILSSTFCLSMSDKARKKLEDEIRALDKDQVHKIVLAVEADPMSKMAEQMRPALVVYFEPIHYDVCLDQVGFLMDSKEKTHRFLFWQSVCSSGDFFLQNPDASKDRFTYMQAGLEGALRTYGHILEKKPKARHAQLDALLHLRNEGHLLDYIRAHPCEKK